MTYAILNQLLGSVFSDKPVSFQEFPWLDNWWRILWRGAWHAPIILLNGHVFSQGIVPDVKALIRAVGERLGDTELVARAETFTGKRQARAGEARVVVYTSPGCPHCRMLVGYLDANNVQYLKKDVTQSAGARQELKQLTRRLAIPVVRIGEKTIVGFDREVLRAELDLDRDSEKDVVRGEACPLPIVETEPLTEKLSEAKELLLKNRVDGRTRASGHLYPHQWNWDAGFIARGYLHFEPATAYEEIRSLFSAQWSDGFLPHIVFNPSYLEHFPGPDYWQANRSGRVPEGVHTSGISQPPVHASMLLAAKRLDPHPDRARAFLGEIYPRLKALHAFFYRFRDPAGEDLVCLVHPWESGLDNAPIWDEPLGRVRGTSPWAQEMCARYDGLATRGQRPKRGYIEKYSPLVESLFSRDYDWNRILESHPFLVQDVLFNSILCQGERDLADIAEWVGADPVPHRKKASAIAEAMNRTLWNEDDGIYYNLDLRTGEQIRRDTIFSYVPLYAGVCDDARTKRLMNNLRTHCYCIADRNCVGIPSYDMCQADYDGEFYWRGPIWYNMCWYMLHGLRGSGEDELASWLEDSLLRLILDNGFYEYYEPETGKGLGADAFSWTAALFIDLATPRVGQ